MYKCRKRKPSLSPWRLRVSVDPKFHVPQTGHSCRWAQRHTAQKRRPDVQKRTGDANHILHWSFLTCRLLFGSASPALAGVSCEECPGTRGVWIRREPGVRWQGRHPVAIALSTERAQIGLHGLRGLCGSAERSLWVSTPGAFLTEFPEQMGWLRR